MLAGARRQQRVGIALRLQGVALVQVLTLPARARLVVDDQGSPFVIKAYEVNVALERDAFDIDAERVLRMATLVLLHHGVAL